MRTTVIIHWNHISNDGGRAACHRLTSGQDEPGELDDVIVLQLFGHEQSLADLTLFLDEDSRRELITVLIESCVTEVYGDRNRPTD